MNHFQHFIAYYKDSGNGKRLAAAFLLIPIALCQLMNTLRRTFCYSWVNSHMLQTGYSLYSGVFLIISLICFGFSVRITMSGVSKAAWPIRLAELTPAFSVCIASLIVNVLYQNQYL